MSYMNWQWIRDSFRHSIVMSGMTRSTHQSWELEASMISASSIVNGRITFRITVWPFCSSDCLLGSEAAAPACYTRCNHEPAWSNHVSVLSPTLEENRSHLLHHEIQHLRVFLVDADCSGGCLSLIVWVRDNSVCVNCISCQCFSCFSNGVR